MAIENTKRVVIIKDIKSHYVEEAILILRKNIKDVPEFGIVNPSEKMESDSLVKEAQRIIDEYIINCKKSAKIRRNAMLNKKYKKPKSYFNKIINIALLCSVVLVVYLVIKLI